MNDTKEQKAPWHETPCPICGFESLAPVYDQKSEFIVLVCISCGFTTNPPQSKFSLLNN